MINTPSAKNWYNAWEGIQRDFAEAPFTTVDAKVGNRAFSFNNTITVLSNDLAGLDYSTVGYLGGKQRMIWYHYFDEQRFNEVSEKLRDRVINRQMDLTVLNYWFLQQKNQHNLDACLSNMYITAHRKNKKYYIEYEIHIRTSEATKRLCADFVFFHLLINKFNEIFEGVDIETIITVKSKALYAQPPFFLISKELLELDLDKDHWFTTALKRDETNLFRESYKFKMGKRVRNYLIKIRESRNED